MAKNTSTTSNLPSKDALRFRLSRFLKKYPYVRGEAEFALDLQHGFVTCSLTCAGISKRMELYALFEKHGFVPMFQAVEEPEAALTEPEAALTEPEAALAEPEAALAEPEAALAVEGPLEPVQATSAPETQAQPRAKRASKAAKAEATGYAPRPGTKLFDLYQKLIAPSGVSLAEGMALTGWTDPHYVRSSSFLLSRRTGRVVECVRSKEENGSRYRLLPN